MKIWLFSQKGGDCWQLYSEYAFRITNTSSIGIFEMLDSESSFRLIYN